MKARRHDIKPNQVAVALHLFAEIGGVEAELKIAVGDRVRTLRMIRTGAVVMVELPNGMVADYSVQLLSQDCEAARQAIRWDITRLMNYGSQG